MNIGDKIELMTTGGSIPGILPGIYYIIDKNAAGRIAIASTPNGTPIKPTGPIVGSPVFQEVNDFEYAFPLQRKAWLNLSLEDYLSLGLNDYLNLDLF